MELHQLKYFVEVANLRSFTRAAEKCCVAQPSLSQQIIKLERELRQPLFERLGRTVRLTQAGNALYDRAVSILGSIDEIHDRLKAATNPDHGTVRVGAIPTIAPYLLPNRLREFSKQFPDATVSLDENLTDFVIRGVVEGDLDIGIIATQVSGNNLDSEVLFTEELFLTMPLKHRLLSKKSICWDDLSGEPFVLMNELHCLGEQMVGFCKQQGCIPTIHCHSVQLLTIQKLVILGHGISLIPSMARENDGSRCAYRSLPAPAPSRTIRMIWHKGRYQSPIIKQFMLEMRNTVKN